MEDLCDIGTVLTLCAMIGGLIWLLQRPDPPKVSDHEPVQLLFAPFDDTKPYTAPEQKSSQAAGFDLCASEDAFPLKDRPCLVPTNLVLEIPEGYYGRIAPRSGLSMKGLFVNAGVIDSDYRGEVKVVLYRVNDTEVEIKSGDRIAQLILEKIATDVEVRQVPIEELTGTARGDGGFGSTG